jgi:predicted O-methyltransferase YrrM
MSKMIPDLEGYFRQFVSPRDSLLLELEEEARQEGIPIVGPVVGELLYILVRASQATQILELGTATGYSAIYLARACDELNGQVVTLEIDAGMASRARANFEKAGLAHRIQVKVGDAMEEIAKMSKPFDFMFVDIDKESYVTVMPHCERLLKSGGLLVADNVGFRAAEDFNRAVFGNPEWRTVHLLSLLPFHSPEKDGLCLALRA